DAGVGKSRLTREFLASVQDEAFIVRGRCLSYGRGITFWPLVEIVRHSAGIEEDDPPERAVARILGLVGDQEVTDRLAAAIGLSEAPVPLTEAFWAVQRLVEILSERGPAVGVFDDSHWAGRNPPEANGPLARAELRLP